MGVHRHSWFRQGAHCSKNGRGTSRRYGLGKPERSGSSVEFSVKIKCNHHGTIRSTTKPGQPDLESYLHQKLLSVSANSQGVKGNIPVDQWRHAKSLKEASESASQPLYRRLGPLYWDTEKAAVRRAFWVTFKDEVKWRGHNLNMAVRNELFHTHLSALQDAQAPLTEYSFIQTLYTWIESTHIYIITLKKYEKTEAVKSRSSATLVVVINFS